MICGGEINCGGTGIHISTDDQSATAKYAGMVGIPKAVGADGNRRSPGGHKSEYMKKGAAGWMEQGSWTYAWWSENDNDSATKSHHLRIDDSHQHNH